MIQWHRRSWWQRAGLLSVGWLVLSGACVRGLLGLLGSRLTEVDRYEIQSAFLTITVAGLCALWFAYWLGRKTMSGGPR